MTTDECHRHPYHYNSDDKEEDDEEEEEEEGTSSSILRDCAPRHCHVATEHSSTSPPSASVPHRSCQSRSRSPYANPSSAVRQHHNHCSTSRVQITDRPSDAVPCNNYRWDIELLRSLRKEPFSNKREAAAKRRQPGRVDISFIPKKGDLIIHHDRKQWRRVLEFYDPSYQRLHDGDILIRIRIDSYSCLGIVLMKGIGYMYHRGHWMFLGTDSDQISQYLRGR